MNKLLRGIFIGVFVIAVLVLQSCKEQNALTNSTISKGFVDLSNWDFEKDGIVKLNGDWEFYWNTFLMDSLRKSEDKMVSGFMYVPGLWNKKIINKFEIPSHGYASYRLKLKLPLNEELGIKYLNSATSCEVFIDGNSHYSSGKPGKTITQTEPSYKPSIITFKPQTEQVEVVLQIANYHHKKGGQWEPIIIGAKDQITQIRDRNVFIELILIGSIFIMAMFHLLVFFKHRFEKPLFYFGLFSMLIGIKMLMSGEFTIYMFFDADWLSIVRIDYLSFYLAVMFFSLYIKSLYPNFNKLISVSVVAISLLFSISVLILPLNYFSYGMFYFQVFTIIGGLFAFVLLVRAVKQKREGALYLSYGFLLLFICMVHDILNENEIFYSISLVPIGITLFIFFQALVLSSRIRFALYSNKQLSEELIIQNAEYAELNEKYKTQNKNLTIAKEKAEESDRFKSAFLANISHEIRTPMNGILGFTELLSENDISDDKRKRYLSIVKERGHYLLGVINDIIDVSKIETGHIDLRLEPTSVNELFDDLFNNYFHLANLKNLNLVKTISLPDHDSIMLADRQKLKQILDNLMSNALKFTQKGKVEFGYYLKDDFIQFYVKDTGIGLSESETEVIFDRFNQANKSIGQKYGGTGLGLSIVKAYVEKMGGQIWVNSIKKEGSTFKFTIPYQPQPQPNKNISEPAKPIVVNELMTILLVEDNKTNAFLINEILETKNVEILHAVDGKEAIDLYEKNLNIDLVLMDIKLPDTNGFELIKVLRSIRDEVPFIAQTAYALKGDKEKALDAGFNDYLAKPIDSKKLNSKIDYYNLMRLK